MYNLPQLTTLFLLLSASFASLLQAAPLTWWNLNSYNTTTMQVSDTRWAYHGTLSSTSVTFTTGKFNNAAWFTNADAGSQITFSSMSGKTYNTPITLSFWANLPETPTAGGVIISATEAGTGFQVVSNADRTLTFTAYGSDGSTYTATSSALTADSWNHVIFELNRSSKTRLRG